MLVRHGCPRSATPALFILWHLLLESPACQTDLSVRIYCNDKGEESAAVYALTDSQADVSLLGDDCAPSVGFGA
jgi:hypothetical protein